MAGLIRTFCRGGFFAGKVASLEESAAAGTRFGTDAGAIAKMYRARYIKDGWFLH